MKNLEVLLLVVAVAVAVMASSAVGDFNCKVTMADGSATEEAVASCIVNGRDIGSGTMDPSTSYSVVAPVKDNQQTTVSCFITLGSRRGLFLLFDSNVDSATCAGKPLRWLIDPNGLSIVINAQFVKKYSWP